jgi:hypothetical protein
VDGGITWTIVDDSATGKGIGTVGSTSIPDDVKKKDPQPAGKF